VTSGTSVLETALLLRDHGLVVTDAVVLLNRLQGGTENLARNGIRLRSVCGVNQFVHVLKEEGRIDEATEAGVLDYIKNNQADVLGEGPKKTLPWKMDFGKRLELTRQSIAGRILECILAKKSNLCVAVDVRSSGELLSLAKKLAPHVCCIKTHVDAVDDWSKESAAALVKIASEGNFLLFEDRKFADIGHTVALQYSKVAEWADFVTAHGLPGKGLIDGLEFVAYKKDDGKLRGAVILAEMSSAGKD
jgi:uridine monophosphate synthetase